MINNSIEDEDEHAKLVQKALYVEPPTRCINLDTTPRDGSEFIHKSRLEDATLKYCLDENVNSTERSNSPESAMIYWGQKRAEEFSHYAMKLKTGKGILRKKFPKMIETPAQEEKEWCTFCLGSELCSKIYGDGNLLENFKEGNPPLLSIVLHFSQKEVKRLIRFHRQWFQIVGMEDAIGKWIFALLACLEKPVDLRYMRFLETFYDECVRKLKTLKGSKKYAVYHVVSLLENYFCVKSYTVGPSLKTIAMIQM